MEKEQNEDERRRDRARGNLKLDEEIRRKLLNLRKGFRTSNSELQRKNYGRPNKNLLFAVRVFYLWMDCGVIRYV